MSFALDAVDDAAAAAAAGSALQGGSLTRSRPPTHPPTTPRAAKPALPAPELSRLVSLGWGATSKGGATPSETLQQASAVGGWLTD